MGPMLYPHQEEALCKLKNGCILCGGTGSGKSRTGLAYFYTKIAGGTIPTCSGGEFQEPKLRIPLYIITTARKRDTGDWGRECVPFLLNEDPERSIHNIPVTVDSWNNIGKYTNVTDAFFLFDEQRVVGYGAWSKAFIKIARNNRWILLSATPGDTWTDYIPVFIANGFYKHKTEFMVRHVVLDPHVNYPKVKQYLDVRTLIAHREQILVDMPVERETVQHHEVIPVEYDKERYQFVVKKRWNIFLDEPIQNAGGYCQVLRRVVGSDPRRISVVQNLLLDHDRAIIFYNYNYELELLRELCEQMERVKAEWNGQLHQEIPDSEKWAYLVQYTAGSEAWNCTETDTIIFYSDNYSYKIMTQASGRIDRLNTPFTNLYYYHLRSSAPIDKAVAKALELKKDFNEKDFYK